VSNPRHAQHPERQGEGSRDQYDRGVGRPFLVSFRFYGVSIPGKLVYGSFLPLVESFLYLSRRVAFFLPLLYFSLTLPDSFLPLCIEVRGGCAIGPGPEVYCWGRVRISFLFSGCCRRVAVGGDGDGARWGV
jgi:hypothetical protein